MHVNLYITNFGQNTMTNCQFEVNVAEVCITFVYTFIIEYRDSRVIDFDHSMICC